MELQRVQRVYASGTMHEDARKVSRKLGAASGGKGRHPGEETVWGREQHLSARQQWYDLGIGRVLR